MIRNTLLTVLALVGASSLALAAEPAPAGDPLWDVLKASMLDVYMVDGRPTLNLHEGRGTRTLKIGDAYTQGWVLTALTPASATFVRSGASAQIDLPEARPATRLARIEDQVEESEEATACAHAEAAQKGGRTNEARQLLGLQPLGPDQVPQPADKRSYEMMVPQPDGFFGVNGYTVSQRLDDRVVWYRTPQYAFEDNALNPVPTAPARVLSCRPAG